MRDEALVLVNFLMGRAHGGNPEIISNLKEELDYGLFEKVKSVAWNGIVKGKCTTPTPVLALFLRTSPFSGT